MSFEYFYGGQSEFFSFYRIPRQLVTGAEFRHLSTEAKLLYGMMLDRMGLSARNGWFDDFDRVYIYYTIDEIMEDLCCGHNKAVRLLAELDTKGVGLIERKRQGQGKPTRIYVKRFTTREVPPKQEKGLETALPLPEVVFSDLQKSAFPTSRSRDFRRAEVEKTDPSNNNINQTDSSHTDPSIYPPCPGAAQMEIDRCETREEIKCQIDYDLLRQEYPHDDVESMMELLVDVLCSTASTIRIGGQIFPIETVKKRYRQLDREHISYVIDSLRQTTTKISNIRAYLLTALYNAPVTIGPYYSAAVRHDFPQSASP